MQMPRTRRRFVVAAALLAAQALPSVAAEGGRWFLDSCPPGSAAGAARQKAEMLAAKPDSDIYVPHPFPQTEAEVIGNFEYQFLDLWAQHPRRDVPDDVWRVVRALTRGEVRFEIIEVTDWTEGRCRNGASQVDFYHVVRVLSARTGEELARIALQENGLLSNFITPAADPRERRPLAVIPSIADLRARSAAAAGATDFQYVAIDSPSVRSGMLGPAIAFRKEGRAFFAMRDGRLFEIDIQRPGVAGTQARESVRGSPRWEAAVAALRPGEHFVTVGSTGVAVAMPLAGESDPP
ncbi:MAG: hypothetical protein M5U13_02035 [Thermoanaerobaculia bacterium]|nr:hypothetical protein [Thermoanaerobaculia bacterium]